jgi:hypothetical protein
MASALPMGPLFSLIQTECWLVSFYKQPLFSHKLKKIVSQFVIDFFGYIIIKSEILCVGLVSPNDPIHGIVLHFDDDHEIITLLHSFLPYLYWN